MPYEQKRKFFKKLLFVAVFGAAWMKDRQEVINETNIHSEADIHVQNLVSSLRSSQFKNGTYGPGSEPPQYLNQIEKIK